MQALLLLWELFRDDCGKVNAINHSLSNIVYGCYQPSIMFKTGCWFLAQNVWEGPLLQVWMCVGQNWWLQSSYVHKCLVVWNRNVIFPFSWECHDPNWRSQIFQRGRRKTTNQIQFWDALFQVWMAFSSKAFPCWPNDRWLRMVTATHGMVNVEKVPSQHEMPPQKPCVFPYWICFLSGRRMVFHMEFGMNGPWYTKRHKPPAIPSRNQTWQWKFHHL